MGYDKLTERKIRYIVRHKQEESATKKSRDEGKCFNCQESLELIEEVLENG